ncbi:MAG: ATP-binding cassette domain-containing protein, partial [Oscillospiraceae bacterium]|nr:ATP-binding cassette domain-containing protein [Oscillospiraceae bacterium]
MALINTQNITLSYENMTVIDDMSFTVGQGDYLCIVGENGSGKSTLMKALLGLKKPVSGSIGFGDGLKQREIGYLPQQTGAQKDFPANVGEVVISGCLNSRGLRPFYSAKERALAMENMMKLGIWELRK